MPIGNSLLAVACLMAVVATLGYGLALFNRNSLISLAQRAYYLFTAATILMSAYLLLQIVNHNFALQYVHSYSSQDLPLGFLISTFWAGQVGSFLLWLLLLAVIGLFLIRRREENQAAVMFFYLLVNCFFLSLLVVRSPFLLIPAHALAQFPGGVPPDGQGLNPLLQNFWMVIHPPVIFLGFALLAVPFSHALAALARNYYDNWARNALRWSVIGSATLGAGIFLGAYWSYETLGWGGYWAWDPVENASLIPWVLSVALIHGLVIELKRGILRRTNLLLALSCFLLVIYGTFLTRSGVLADFSVHSFTDLGTSAYMILFMIFFLGLSIVLLIVRLRSAATGLNLKDKYSADSVVLIGVFVLLLFALLTLAGTSAPLITRLFGEPANVSISYYNSNSLPLAVLMAFLIGIAPLLLRWDKSRSVLLRRLLPVLLLSAVSVVVAVLLGVRQVSHLLLVFSAAFAVCTNLLLIFLTPGRIGLRSGGFLAHIGVGLLIIGILASSLFSRTEKINLYSGATPTETLGARISYQGMRGDINTRDNALLLEVENGGQHFTADPKYFIARENQGLMRKPYIKKYWLYDLYLSPQSQKTVGDGDKLILAKGQESQIGDYRIKFLDFDLGSHDAGAGMRVGARLEISHDSLTERITPYLAFHSSDMTSDTEPLPGGRGAVRLLDVRADAGMISLQFTGIEGLAVVDLLILEVAKKPLINLVWLGLVLICVGMFLSFLRRLKTAP